MTDPRFWLGVFAAVAAVVLVGVLAFGPRHTVPRERRRWGEVRDSPLTVVARHLTALVQRLLGVRSLQLAEVLALAGVKQSPQDFVIIVAVAALVLLAVGFLVGGILLGLVLAMASLPGVWLVLRVLTDRRRAAFGRQLDEVLQMLAGSLRAGYSLPQGIATVATELEDPAGPEFARVLNEARVGRPLVDALEDAGERLDNDDFRWTVQAITINRDVGGNLADVLDAVGETIRERIHLKRQVEALAADGKFSGIILTLMPIVVGVMITLLNPSYMSRMFTHPLGIVMIVIGVVMLVLGALWMRVLVKIKF
nr:type II secretion system protein F [Propionibacterium sp.]